MFSFFDMIAGWLDTLDNVIATVIDNLLLLIMLLMQLVTTPIALAAYMPSVIGVAIFATLLIFVIKFFLGR